MDVQKTILTDERARALECEVKPSPQQRLQGVSRLVTGHDTIEMVKKYIAKKRNAQLAIELLDTATSA